MFLDHRSAVVADFRQYYNYDLPVGDVDELDDFERVVMLFAELPQCARSHVVIDADAQWSTTDLMLWSLEYQLRVLQFSMISKKDRQGIPEPKPIQTPAERTHNLQRAANAEKNKAEINKILGFES